MWYNVDWIIQRIDSQLEFDSKATDLYDSQYCYKEDEDCSLQSTPFIRELVQTKRPFGIVYGFRSHCTSIDECFFKLEDCIKSIQNNQRNIFPPFDNEFLPPSTNITLKGHPIIFH